VILSVSAEQDEGKKEEKAILKEKKLLDDQIPIKIESHDKDSEKIDKKILKLFRTQEKPEFGLNLPDAENKTSVYVYLDRKESIQEIAPKVKIDGIADNIIVTKLSLQEMNEIANLTAVIRIATPEKAVFYNHLVGQGISFTSANTFHAAGIDGTGVKLAIIDDSFFTTDPEITSNVFSSVLFDSSNFCSGSITCGNAPGNSHGTAVAEIVVDMAPNVDLLLYVIGNSVDFDNAIDDAISRGANIITASLGFPTAGGDGTTGFFRDGTSTVAKKVNFAQSTGRLVTIAAGNEAQSHWKGNYVVSSANPTPFGLSSYQSVLEFQPAASGNLKACLPITDNGDIYVMSWNDWTTTTNDYDIFLYDPTASTIRAGSVDDQTLGGSPIEVFQGIDSGSACLVVASWSSSQNHLIHIDTEGNPINSAFRIRTGSIGTPADATGALAVGAIRYDTDNLESFSSSGPTDDGRLKPEICGPDGILSHQSGLNPFFGTSSATPHVAGAAALLLDQNPSLTNTQLKTALTSSARFDPNYSLDNLCGANSGALFLSLPVATCGVSLISGFPIIYDLLKPGETSAEQTLVLDNTGSSQATLNVQSSQWRDSFLVNQMDSSQTRFSTSGATTYSSKTPLSTSLQPITSTFSPTENINTYWQVLVSPTDPSFTGSLQQEMTFTVSCQ
jgi:subtilisin family serine protease